MKEEFFQAVFRLIVAGHQITDGLGRKLKEEGFTEPQFNVLKILQAAKGKPITVQEISSKMVQRSSNVTRIIDKLIAKELVIREICPSNRRKMDNSITEKGTEVLKILDKKVIEFYVPMKDNLSPEELELLQKLITKLTSTINE